MKNILRPMLVAALILATVPLAGAQDKAAPATPTPKPATMLPTPIKLAVTMSRYQGEKKISSIPFTISVSVSRPYSKGSLRMGSKIPVMMIAGPVVDGQKMPAAGPVQYQDVGTNIDCAAYPLDDGGFKIELTIEDTSVVADDKAGKNDQPTLRSFRVSNSMNLKDGQAGQFTSAVDKVSGEITKVDVTLTVAK